MINMASEETQAAPVYGGKGQDFEDHFDPYEYLKMYFSKDPIESWAMKMLTDFHNTFDKIPLTGGRLLDIGSGPCIHSVLSASRMFSEIYLSDFSSRNREALQDWIDSKPNQHDWSHYFRAVAKMEGVQYHHIETRLRSSIKGVLHCDLLNDVIVANQSKTFDCITSTSCLEGVCLTYDSYKESIRKIRKLLKDGGYLVIMGIIGDESYSVGDKTFRALKLNLQQAKLAFEAEGYKDIKVKVMYFTEEDIAQIDTTEITAGGIFTLAAHI